MLSQSVAFSLLLRSCPLTLPCTCCCHAWPSMCAVSCCGCNPFFSATPCFAFSLCIVIFALVKVYGCHTVCTFNFGVITGTCCKETFFNRLLWQLCRQCCPSTLPSCAPTPLGTQMSGCGWLGRPSLAAWQSRCWVSPTSSSLPLSLHLIIALPQTWLALPFHGLTPMPGLCPHPHPLPPLPHTQTPPQLFAGASCVQPAIH